MQLRHTPATMARPVASKPRVPGSGTVELLLPQPPPMTLSSSVTAPLIAKALPQPMLAPVFNVMLPTMGAVRTRGQTGEGCETSYRFLFFLGAKEISASAGAIALNHSASAQISLVGH